MNELKIFKNDEFGEIRTLEIENEPWFIGKDVCRLFGDKNHNRSIGRVDEIDKRCEEITDSIGRKQKAIFVNESGLYSLLFAMQPQKAHHDGVSDEYPIEIQERIDRLHRFKRWVTSEVLPAIRKHGAYATAPTIDKILDDPDYGIRLLQNLKEEREKRKALEVQNAVMIPKGCVCRRCHNERLLHPDRRSCKAAPTERSRDRPEATVRLAQKPRLLDQAQGR